MAKNFAKINSLNEVVQIFVVDDAETQSSVEAMFDDTDVCLYRETGPSIREREAQIGGTYDPVNDAFISKQPYASWTLNGSREWEPPVAEPTAEQLGVKDLFWDEANQQWKAKEIIDGVLTISTWNPSTLTWS